MSECWIDPKLKPHNRSGYSYITFEYHKYRGHVASYRILKGDIPVGFDVHHECGNRACYNPKHLSLVDHREHAKEHDNVGRFQREKTHCKRGHEFTPETTYVDSRGYRKCKICLQEYNRNYKIIK